MRERQLRGAWETEATPKRTLDLHADGTYSQRFSGKTLGFLSDLAGPETGTWEVDGESLVLTQKNEKGVESTTRLPIRELGGESVVLGDERWSRKRDAVGK